jgi:TPR repeat protein
MARQAPWSVKGVDEDARQIARDAADAAGMPIGAWIDRAILQATGAAGTTEPDPSALSQPSLPARIEPRPVPPAPTPASAPEPAAPPAPAASAAPEKAYEPRHPDLVAAAAPRDDGQHAGYRPHAAGPMAGPLRRARRRRRGRPRLVGLSVGVLVVVALVGGGVWLIDRMGAPPAPPQQKAEAPPATQTAPAPAAPPGAAPGDGAPADPAARVRAVTEAARGGDAKAQYDLGVLFARGEDVPRDDKGAVEWFERAALRGYAPAQYNLGVAYEQGRGIDRNPPLAFFWYQSAAEQGHVRAQHNLGTLYAEGIGTPRNYEQARNWFTKAAEGGVVESIYSLGLLHENGLGVKQDRVRAEEHYRKAASGGSERAAVRLKALADLPAGAAPSPAAPGAAPPATEMPPATPSKPLGRKGIAEVQRLLRQLSFEPGAADGIAGGRTIEAIRLYQQFAGLTVDGKPTEALLQDLRQVVEGMATDPAAPSTGR